MTDDYYIYLGYDPIRRCTWAYYQSTLIRINDCIRARAGEVIDGLCKVGIRLEQSHLTHVLGQPEVYVQVNNPWQVKVGYSHQAWSDLLEIGRVV